MASASEGDALERAWRDLEQAPADERRHRLTELLRATQAELDLEWARSAAQEETAALRRLFVGREDELASVLAWLTRAAGTDLPALLVGEAGTGKLTTARALHAASPRRSHPLHTVDGEAVRTAEGVERACRTAAAGTLVVRSVEQLVPAAQAALLEALRAGPPPRLIATTEGDLDGRVAMGAFVGALRDRLSILPHRLAPIRATPGAAHALFLLALAEAAPAGVTPRLEAGAAEWVASQPWRGNVTELAATATQAWAAAAPGPIGERDLVAAHAALRAGPAASAPGDGGPTLEEVERACIAARLEQLEWHQARTAASLGIDRKTLYRKIRRYGLEP